MRRNITPILWMVILAGVPAALFGWHFLGEWQRIGEFNQRELGRAADNLKSILHNAAVNVGNLTSQPPRFFKRLAYLDITRGQQCENVHNVTREKGVRAVLCTVEDGLAVVAETSPLEFRVNLEKILDELVVGEGFEYLFVADENGKILFQTRRGESKRWIDRLRWADRHARDESFEPVNPVRLRSIAELTASAGVQPAPGKFASTTISSRVKIAGENYHLYLQPIGSLAEIAPGSDSPSAIVLGGLVNAQASIAEALAVDPWLALGLALLAGLGLLTWPLLKLFVLAPGERFKFVDSYLLLLSASALLMVGTVVLLDLDNYLRLDSSRGNRLELLAEGLKDGLINELSRTAQQLKTYDSALAGQGRMNCQNKLEAKWLFAPPGPQALRVSPPHLLWHLISAFWVRGDDGWQFAKLTPFDENTPFVNVAERPYFREGREKHLWRIAYPVNDPEFFVQTYRSITTGEFETGLSMPSDVKCAAQPDAREPVFPNVAVLTTRLASLSRKPLPPDYGFMMIDRSGRVLYHTDPRLALREDLFEEVSDPERLRAVVMAARPEHNITNYRSVPNELYIRPLSEIVMELPESTGSEPSQSNGWFIVTFRDLRLPQTVNSEAVLTTLVWCSFYFVPLLFMPALILVLRGPKHNSWIWPNRAKEILYRSLAIKLVPLTVVAIVAIGIARGWELVVASCLIGATTMGLGAWEYLRWKDRQEKGADRKSNFLAGLPARWWQMSAAALMFILVSVIPAAGLFKFVWNQELGTLLAYDAKYLSEAREDLRQQITDGARDDFAEAYANVKKETWEQIVENLVHEQIIPNERIAAVWRELKLGMANADGLVDVLARWKPVYNDASAALRYEESKPDLVARPGLAMRPGLIALVGGVLLIGALLWWIRHWARHLLLSELADIAPDATEVMSEIQAAAKDGRNLIIVTSSKTQENAIQALVAGLGGPETPPVSVGGGAQPLPANASRGTILDLTEAFRNAESRQTALPRLEQIAASGGAIVFSRVDPAVLLFGDAPVAAPSDGPRPQAESTPLDEWERRRWSDVLERFSIVLVPLLPEAAAEQAGTTGNGVHQCTRSRPLYWSLWNSCTNLERLVLVQVAEEGFANPRQTQTVEHLLRRGLLIMKPDLQPFHPDFRQFIEEVFDRKTVGEWERPSRGMGWTQARWILAIMVVTVALFLLGTQRQALTPVVGFVSTLTGAFLGVLKLISEVNPKQHV